MGILGRSATVGAMALALGGCPSNTSTHLVGLSAPPAWTIEFRHGTIRGAPTQFIQYRYLVRSGDTILWQIDRERRACDDGNWEGERAFPTELRYGETPSCYRQTVAATPLEDGRAYRLESDDPRYNHSLHFVSNTFTVEAGRVKPISEKQYRRMTGAQ